MHLKFNSMFKALLIVALASSGAASASPASLKWAFSLDSSTQNRSASSDDGTTYITTDDYLYAINSDGSEKWRHHATDSSFLSPAVGPDGTIYVNDSNQKALNAFSSNGTLLWQENFGQVKTLNRQPAISSEGQLYQVTFSTSGTDVFTKKNGQRSRVLGDIFNYDNGPVSIAYDGEIYLPLRKEIATVSRKRYRFSSDLFTFDIEYSSSLALDNNKRLYVVGTSSGDQNKLFAFDREQTPSSNSSWDWSWGDSSLIYQDAPIIGQNGDIYVITVSQSLATLHSISSSGVDNWRYSGISSIAPVAAADGTIYAVSSSGNLLALDNRNGSLKWQYTPPAPIASDITMDQSGVIYASSDNNKLFAIQTPSTTAANSGWPMKGQNIYGTYAQKIIDNDGDGVLNEVDNCPNDANPDQLNSDGANDGGNVCDEDDDNDGVADIYDAFPLDSNESLDTDKDGLGNNADTDDDNDGILDINDEFPLDSKNTFNVKWITEINDTTYTPNAGYTPQIALSPNGIIYVPYGQRVYAIEPNVGVKWRYDTETYRFDNPAVNGNNELIISDSKTLYAINDNGELIWSKGSADLYGKVPYYQTIDSYNNVHFVDGNSYLHSTIYQVHPNGNADQIGSLSYGDETSLTTTVNGDIIASDNNALIKFNKDQTQFRFDYPNNLLGYPQPASVTKNNRIYLNLLTFAGNTVLLAYDGTQSSGSAPLWQWYPDEYEHLLANKEPIVGNDDVIYVVHTYRSGGFSLSAISSDGQRLWRVNNVKPISPVVSEENTIYTITENGDLLALNSDGTIKSQVSTSIPLIGPLIMDQNGVLYSTTAEKQVVAVTTSSSPANEGWPMAGQNAQNTRSQAMSDKDGDGIADALDNCPDIANPDQLNTDNANDGGNACDTDDDNDGVVDVNDAFPLDKNEWVDTDLDGTGNNADTDDDNDGVLDINDTFPLDATEWVDTDKDGIGNNADTDDDNDGVRDTADAFPLDASEYQDHDYDGIGNNADPDDDGDGVLDINDPFPTDGNETLDSDGDGIGNNADIDDDNDGVPDSDDAFPFEAGESVDTDKDGVGNNADTDDDNDGVLDVDDAFPLDAHESLDSDKDGIGNNQDNDDDNDGLSDTEESQLGTSPVLADTDGDGINDPDEAQYGTSPLLFDTDNDGLSDGFEIAYGYDPLVNQADSGADIDSDNDGLTNAQEMTNGTHPNKADTDEDGLEDGIEVNTYGTNPLKADSDGDGLSDIAEIDEHKTNPLKADSDDDQLPDSWEVQYQLDPLTDDSLLDTDKDNRDNLTEYQDQTNPQVAEIVDTENNETLATAQAVDHGFNLVFSKNVGDSKHNTSETLPHVTVMGKGNIEQDVDFYQFTVLEQNAKVILDIDQDTSSKVRFDSFIELINASGTVIYANDDAEWHKQGQEGSVSITDSYLELTIAQPGIYYVKVTSYLDGYVPQDAAYTLHISVEHANVAGQQEQEPEQTSTQP